ncbi:helix-turn-helix domain-containing protein [Mycolicibacterium austroafricanum]|uniref:helix-turn-helix domain-containing protein n=1 Tax=Mycolicibacterium austroafricanum TaxID=39687 RepID=UPI001CA33119|nr:helix-turn-helix domain-containing protein [Mycolicibacterium austroafricanum]QZT60934.1 helix-turn-helix domain-containing protein [Mycolicibacterium austroafricanum]
MSSELTTPRMDARRWHQWCGHVLRHPDLTPAHKLVLLALAQFSDYPQGTNARPGVEVLAEACGLGERVVLYALGAARRLKLIKQTQPANVKRGRAAVYQLLPALATTCTDVHLVDPNQVHAHSRPGAQNDTNRCTSVHPTDSLPSQDRGVSPESGTALGEPRPSSDDPPPKQSANGQTQTPAAAAASGAPPTAVIHTPAGPVELPLPLNHWDTQYPEPAEPACSKHPVDTGVACHECGRARQRRPAWEAARDQWRRDRDTADGAWINACAECDEDGWLYRTVTERDEHGRWHQRRVCGDDPNDPLRHYAPGPTRCGHATLWDAWWRTRLPQPEKSDR